MNSSGHAALGYLRSLLSHPRGDEDNDCELLRRFLESRDGDAFALLMRRHGLMVLGLARRILGDAHLAEDVFQAAFFLLARQAPTIRRLESLPCWLHGVTFRLALRVRRSHKRRQMRETHFHSPPSPSPLEELSALELLTVLDEELHKLPENQRAPLILCCLEGLSQEEAARRLGCSPSAVKGRLERGRQRLRLRLEKRGLTLPAALSGTLLFAGSTRAVPATLMQSTLDTATTGACLPPAIAALMKGTIRSMFLHKLKLASAALVLLGSAGGFGMVMLREIEQPPQRSVLATLPEKVAAREAKKDLYGDPLPKGAIMRLGTLQRRAVGARLAVSSDGQSIVGVRGRKYLHIWDAATGKIRQTRELPGEDIANLMLSPDGKMLAMAGEKEKLTVWDVPTGKRLQTLVLKGVSAAWCIPLIAFSSDGQKIAAVGWRQERQDGSGRHDDLIRVWDLRSGKELFRTDIRNNNQSYLLTFSPDGQRLLASFNNSQGTYCCCWDLDSGRQVWQNKDNGWFYPVITPDGKILASEHIENQKPRGVDLATGQTMPLEKAPPIEIGTGLAVTPDGRTLLVSTAQGVIVWDMVQGKELRRLSGAGEEIAVLPDGKSIITNNGSLQRWDLATGKPLWADTFALGHIGEVVSVAFSADGSRLASTATDGSVRLWDTKTGKPLRLWRGHLPQRPTIMTEAWLAAGAKTVDISPDGRRILSAAKNEQIKLWDTAEVKGTHSLTLPEPEKGEGERSVFQARIRSDGAEAVAVFGSTGFVPRLATWDLNTGKLCACRPVEISLPIDIRQAQSSFLAPDGQTWLINGVLVDAISGHEIARLEGGVPYPRAFSGNGSLLVGGSSRKIEKDGRSTYTRDGLRIWETATGQVVAHLKTNVWPGLLAFHPNNRFLAISSWDGVQLWDTVGGKLFTTTQMPERLRSMTAQLSYASCLAFAADGRLATGHPDGTILLWEMSLPVSRPEPLTAKELQTLWADLADSDAAKAWRAVWRLADSPDTAMMYLGGRVKPSPTAPPDLTRRLLADMDSDSFQVREEAGKRLKELGLKAEPALRAALKTNPSLEQRRRIEPILAALFKMPEKLSPEELRQLRTLIVLERIGMQEARRLLEKAAQGPPSARLTRQARACLAHLR